jgi:hypothetical protein
VHACCARRMHAAHTPQEIPPKALWHRRRRAAQGEAAELGRESVQCEGGRENAQKAGRGCAGLPRQMAAGGVVPLAIERLAALKHRQHTLKALRHVSGAVRPVASMTHALDARVRVEVASEQRGSRPDACGCARMCEAAQREPSGRTWTLSGTSMSPAAPVMSVRT